MGDAPNPLLPKPTPETAYWWESCRKHCLLIQQCSDCGSYQFYPRVICSTCLGGRLDWVEAAGTATVETFTICRVPVAEAYADRVPYVVAVVRLEEGPTMMTNIIDCNPESVAIGMCVEVAFERWSDEIVLPQFRPRKRTAER